MSDEKIAEVESDSERRLSKPFVFALQFATQGEKRWTGSKFVDSSLVDGPPNSFRMRARVGFLPSPSHPVWRGRGLGIMVESLCHGELYHEFKIMGVSVLRHGNIWKPETELGGAVSVTSCNELPAQSTVFGGSLGVGRWNEMGC